MTRVLSAVWRNGSPGTSTAVLASNRSQTDHERISGFEPSGGTSEYRLRGA